MKKIRLRLLVQGAVSLSKGLQAFEFIQLE